MNKILGFLEQKVQWFAFCGGVAYVLYMAWTYLISAPVTVQISELSPTPLRPGEVDARIDEVIANEVERKLQDPRTLSVPPAPDYVASFTSAMSYSGKTAAPYKDAVAIMLHGTPNVNMPGAGPNIAPPPGGGAPPAAPIAVGPADQNAKAPVSRLPVPPAAAVTAMRTGLTNVAAYLVGQSAPQDPPPGADKCWVTVRFEIDPAALAKEWQDCKLPPPNYTNTAFIQVVLTRQQLQSDGSWGPDTVIPALAALKLLPYPGDNVQGKDPKERWDYLHWAAQHTTDILQPPFYAKIKGDDWAVPGEELPKVEQNKPVFDAQAAASMTDEEFNKTNPTPEHRRLRQQAKDKARQEQGRGRGEPAPRPTRGAPPPDFAPVDPDRPVHYQVVEDDVEKPTVEGTVVGNVSGAGKLVIPSGQFDPTNWAKQHGSQPIVGWAHDDTAEPGATYRYRITYRMKNPVFVAPMTVVQTPNLSDPFSLTSPTSAWSPPVDVASTITFYVASGPKAGGSSVAMQVFRWKGGQPRSKTFNVGVGDTIGSKDGEVDYGTGWTLVDFRSDGGRDDYVLLMDPFGNMRRHDVKTDTQDPKFLKLKEQSAPGAAAAATP